LDVGLLNDRCQRLLGQPPWLQEAWEVGALAELGDPKLDGAGTSLPGPLTVAIALRQSLGVLLAIGSTGQFAHLQFHQALGGKADHLAQQVGVRGLLDPGP